jgi:hypothetical protein
MAEPRWMRPKCERCCVHPPEPESTICIRCRFRFAYTGPLPETVTEGLSE